MTAAVEPLRETLLARVHEERDVELAAAERRAAEIGAAAERHGRELVEQARTEGAATAALAGEQERVAARRRARARVLAVQRTLYDEARAAAIAAAQELRDSTGYAALVERVSAAARAQLGRRATVVPDPDGGIRAHAGDRSVDYTLPTLAERCLEWLGADVERLWR